MRTTVNLDEHLLKDAKLAAQRSGKTLTAFIEQALRARLFPTPATLRKERVRLPTSGGEGLYPGVDPHILDNNSALLEYMESLPKDPDADPS